MLEVRDAKAWFERIRMEVGEIAAYGSVCDVGLAVCSPREHILAARMADKVDGLQTEDVLGLMVLIGWELCERS